VVAYLSSCTRTAPNLITRQRKEQIHPPKSDDFDPRLGGFNVLNVSEAAESAAGDQFFEVINKPFLEAAIKRGDDIAFATIPTRKSDLLQLNGSLRNTFAHEVSYLVKHNIKPINITTKQWDSIKGWLN
jgi:hypothetical protein